MGEFYKSRGVLPHPPERSASSRAGVVVHESGWLGMSELANESEPGQKRTSRNLSNDQGAGAHGIAGEPQCHSGELFGRGRQIIINLIRQQYDQSIGL